MEPRTHTYRRNQAILLELSLLALLGLFCLLMARSTYFRAEPEVIGTAIMVDLTFTAALCHWLLGIRLAGLPHWTIVPVLALGLSLGRALLPADLANVGAYSLVAVAVIEGSAMLFAIFNLRKIVRAVRAARRQGVNGFDALEAALLSLMPSAPLFVSYARFELQVWTMCFAGWFFARRPADGARVFTHHKEPHWFALVGVLLFLVVVEAVVVHVLLQAYHFTTAKWIFAALSGYALVWLLGDLQALRVYRSSIRTRAGEPVLELRIGARGHATIPVRNIAKVEVGAWDKAGPDEALFVLFGKANVKLSLHAPSAFKPAIGGEQRVRTLLTQIDDAEGFRAALLRCETAYPQ
ncbi:MAG TPA: hypothetical protein VMF89_37580 [Polyangiales bacterium]|nr:hypothetical protein [Polyangiales bacterium]